jgi:hypothetical protein
MRIRLACILALVLWAGPVRAAPAKDVLTVSLYDGNGSPAQQGFSYLAFPAGASAVQADATLDTTPATGDLAGFFARPARVPPLDRQAGYTLRFRVQLSSEAHAGSDRNNDGVDDRAGLSVLALSSDARGIELGFWSDRVWAQADGSAEPPAGALFTHAEEAAWDTTAPTTYELAIAGDTYTLRAGTEEILTGPLRDYQAFAGAINPYRTPNLLFLGDDTSSAAATMTFGPISLTTARRDERILLPLVARDG